ncbi:uncharacterized protein LOC117110635 [Anneissia japonica]|uniref:uncharacterized protein LOC117110635 n=1 Tax=Anneissia japonica TaxID=1529436 RepID=UPI00142555D6|nr:uncharacterized protein LOC117110635 [Anneissia japonica]
MMSSPKDVADWQEEIVSATKKTVCGLYDCYSEVYNKIVGSFQDDGHRLTISGICALIPNKSSRILDFAAGTGLFGKILHSNGYTNIDALDGSALSIEQAKNENIYTKLMVEFVEDKGLSIDNDSYDALVCYGGFAYNHLPVTVLSEWIRCVKPGGYIINSFRIKWMTNCPMYNEGKLETEMERLEKEKKWTLISKDVTDADDDTCVVMYVHQVKKFHGQTTPLN